VFWLINISVLILGEALELLTGARQVVHPEEGLLFGVVFVPCQEDVTCLSGIQGDCKVTAKTYIKWKTGARLFVFFFSLCMGFSIDIKL
jgi:hypothetical protein